MNRTYTPGFTLVELLVAIAVLAIVTTVALPSFAEMVRSNRQVAQANELLTAIMYARSEAARLRVPVTLCASEDGGSCVATNTWERGWLVYADADEDAAVDDGEVLRVWAGLDGQGTTLRAVPAATAISYDASGNVDAKRSLVLCDRKGAKFAKAINISSVGRPQMASHAAAGGKNNDPEIVDDVSGSDIAC